MAYARHQKAASSGSEKHGAIETTLHQKDMKTRTADPPSDRTKGPSVNEGATRDGVAKSHAITDGRTA